MPRARGSDRADNSAESPQRARIRAISAELFASKGYNAVGVAEIGHAVGLGRGALYYHMSSKEDLLYDIASRYMTALVEEGRRMLTQEHDPVARIKLLSRHLMRTIADHLSELTVCFREVNSLTGDRHRLVADLHLQYQQLWAETMADGAARGVFRSLDPVALKGILGMYFYSFLWLNPQGYHRPEAIANIFADLVFRAVAPEPEPASRSRQT
jgi:AcrR family transcriptional regulator